MDKLDQAIKEINLITTDSIPYEKYFNQSFNLDNENVNITSSISVYEFVKKFYELYIKFKKEYDTLPQLNLGEYVSIFEYNEDKDEYSCFKQLQLYIDNPYVYTEGNILRLLFLDDIYTACLTNNKNPLSKDYYKKYLEINNNIIKQYIDLFSKYKELIDLYQYLRIEKIFSSYATKVFSEIDGDLLDKLNTFKITIGNFYMNTETYFEIIFNLKNKLSINYRKSKIVLEKEKITLPKEDVDKILKKLYINKKYFKKEELK